MPSKTGFPVSNGIMAAAIRAHDWSNSPLGPIVAWPATLRTSVNIVLDSAFPSFLVWGTDQTLLYNDAYAEILCNKHPAALGQAFHAVWHEIWDVLGPLVERTLVGGESHKMNDVALVMQRKGYAEHTWFTYSYGPVRGDDGRILGLLCNCIETTESILRQRRQAADEAVLREHQSASREDAERVRLALAAGAIIGTWSWDLPTDRFTVDEAFARAFGLDPAIGRTGLSLAQVVATVHPDDQAGLAQAINTVIARGGQYAHQYRVRRADGRYYWIEANGRVDLAPDGTGLLFPGVLIDVESRRTVEAERDRAILKLRALNEELEQKVLAQALARGRTWQLSPDVLGVLNADGYMESSNPAWEATLGWTEDEVSGTPFLDFIHHDDRAPTEAVWRAVLEQGIPALRFENRYRHKAGGWRWLSWVAVPDDGKVYCAARDITIERERQAALERAHEQLRHSQKMEAVGQLTGGLAHDFNNLLAGVAGSLDLIKLRLAQDRSGEIERYVGVAQGATRRAAALTHRLLAFSRRQTLAPRATCVNTMVEGMLDMIRRTVGPGVRVEPDYSSAPWAALVDQSQLENALLNLCINARDAMPDGGRIAIATANRVFDPDAARGQELAPGDYLTLSVSDTGTGMPPDVRAKAFDPFFTTKPLGQGTGLGLSMIYGFAKQSGGQVHIDSEPGQGTTVSIYLPRHRGAAENLVADPASEAAPPAGQGETILVVDDEPSVRMLVVDLLEDLGYTVLEAEDGASGLRLLQSGARIDLLISDVGLPGMMNGRQMADAARVRRPGLKVLFITGYAENALLDHGQLAQGMSVLTKPFSVDTMAQRVSALVGR
ncbi:hybrid sensor histidine kinase/response regulator [Telluria beijingensis]|uniref:hybrid sensor histidine kinase/response regulator n=1 Tax=Telluria beijingensis TaxID=3068633 RepID=UPI002795767B|nr:hybrid sensor histidine kinase/response regulator [Massilia sp. REN29]